MANHNELIEISGLTAAEISEIRLNTQIIGELLQTRKEKGLTQAELKDISGVNQPTIAKIESGKVDPQLSTLMRLLTPLGKTLAVVPLERKAN